MMMDAADLAGLSVLQLIHENVAAATMYGIDRLDQNETHNVLFYNMGGDDTEVTIAQFSTITEVPSGKVYEHIEILSEVFESALGGNEFDKVIVNMMIEEFNGMKERQGEPDVSTNMRAVKRLQKEATKCKDILSANKHY
jgi:molecular chaperone DnaK (HSP70)